jgi:hypothetical protein
MYRQENSGKKDMGTGDIIGKKNLDGIYRINRIFDPMSSHPVHPVHPVKNDFR